MGLLTRGLAWKAEEVKVLMAKIRPELKDRGIHSYQTTYVAAVPSFDLLSPPAVFPPGPVAD